MLLTSAFRFLVLLVEYSGTCTELPQGKRLWTDTKFPVKKGTELVVACEKGYTFSSGDRTLTCVQDAEYEYLGQFPSCTIG